jgi:hypothetical protein
MSTRLRHPRGLPLVGLLVMAIAGVWAGPHTPPWFDPDDACLRGTPCPGDAESAQVLRALSWVSWTGAVLLVMGVALAAWALTRSATAGSPSRLADARRTAAHACAAGIVTTAVVAVAGVAGLAATLGVSEQLGLATLAGCWVLLGRALESLQRSLGLPAGAGPAYLSSLVVAGLASLATVAAVVGRVTDDYWWAVMTAGLVAAAATVLSDVVAWGRWPAARVVAVLVVGSTAVGGLGAALAALGLLQPVEQPPTATPPPVEVGPRPPAPPSTPTIPDPTTTTPNPGVAARKPCAATDMRLDLDGFDAAMGARVVTLRASNSSADACYLDGFAAVSLRQGGQRLDVVSGRTSSEHPGSGGRATRVGLGPGDAASATLYWRGYGAAADTTTPQTLEVTLRPGTQPLSVAVGPQLFDLVDGGELRVGNWVAAG